LCFDTYGQYDIRVNSLHPDGLAKPIIMNEASPADQPEVMGAMQNAAGALIAAGRHPPRE